MQCKVTCILYKQRHISVSSFVYKYDQWPHDSHQLCLSSRYVFSYHPFYFDFHSAHIIFDVSSGLYFWNVNRLKMTTFKIVFTFDGFFSAETTCTARWHVFYISNGTFQSALLFTSMISDPMTVTWQEYSVSERQTT
jgi:hypothetical protein